MLPQTCRSWFKLYEPLTHSPTRVEPSSEASQYEPFARILTQDVYHHGPPARNRHTFNLHYKPPARKMISTYPIPEAIATSCAKILQIAS